MPQRLQVGDVLQLEVCKQAEILGDEQSLTRPITSVTIMDTVRMDRWVHADELLTIGDFWESTITPDYLKRLARKNIAGILTKQKYRRYLNDTIRALCDHYHLPIIVNPNHYSWSETIAPISQAILRCHLTELDTAEHFHRTLTESLVQEKTFANLCAALHHISEQPMAIMNRDWRLTDFSPGVDWKTLLADFRARDLTNHQILGYSRAQEPAFGSSWTPPHSHGAQPHPRILFFPVKAADEVVAQLLVLSDTEGSELSGARIAQLETVAATYVLRRQLYREFQKKHLHYRRMILDELLDSGPETEASRTEYGIALGLHLEERYRLMLVRSQRTSSLREFMDMVRLEGLEDFLVAQESCFRQIPVFTRRRYWVLLLGESFEQNPALRETLLHAMRAYYTDDSLLAGVSDPHPFSSLSTAYREAHQALTFLRTNRNGHCLQAYAGLGVLKLLTDDRGAVNRLFLDEMQQRHIQPLLDWDRDHHSELLLTLQTFLARNRSYAETSHALFIHVNTLRARLKRIESLLGLDLNATAHLLNISLALEMHQTALVSDHQKRREPTS
ncbi:MAG: helix-turn-helix domain-containing protein [Actinomycetes bacterium]|jgi:sugar diacid utilization regulator|nr:helix-turn-helix domain-containing protein [Actinomycetes bacterium]